MTDRTQAPRPAAQPAAAKYPDVSVRGGGNVDLLVKPSGRLIYTVEKGANIIPWFGSNKRVAAK